MGLARRELIGAALLLLALTILAGFRWAVLVVAPELAVSVAVGTTHRDPWGNFLMRPPTGLHDTDAHVYYSLGPNGVDDSHMYDGAEEVLQIGHGTIQAMTDTALITTLVLGSTPKQPYFYARLLGSRPPASGRSQTQPSEVSHDPTSRWQARIARGVQGDDILLTWERSWRADLLPAARALAGLALVALGWLVGLRPKAPRDPRLLVEGLRVVGLASPSQRRRSRTARPAWSVRTSTSPRSSSRRGTAR